MTTSTPFFTWPDGGSELVETHAKVHTLAFTDNSVAPMNESQVHSNACAGAKVRFDAKDPEAFANAYANRARSGCNLASRQNNNDSCAVLNTLLIGFCLKKTLAPFILCWFIGSATTDRAKGEACLALG